MRRIDGNGELSLRDQLGRQGAERPEEEAARLDVEIDQLRAAVDKVNKAPSLLAPRRQQLHAELEKVIREIADVENGVVGRMLAGNSALTKIGTGYFELGDGRGDLYTQRHLLTQALKKLEAMAEPQNALTDEERARRRTELEANILVLQIERKQLRRRSPRRIAHRWDAPGEVLLDLATVPKDADLISIARRAENLNFPLQRARDIAGDVARTLGDERRAFADYVKAVELAEAERQREAQRLRFHDPQTEQEALRETARITRELDLVRDELRDKEAAVAEAQERQRLASAIAKEADRALKAFYGKNPSLRRQPARTIGYSRRSDPLEFLQRQTPWMQR